MNWNRVTTHRTDASGRSRRVIALITVGFALAASMTLVHGKSGQADDSISLAAADWKLAADRAGFTLASDDQSTDGTTRIMAYDHRDGRLEFVVILKPASPDGTLESERASRWEAIRASAPEKLDEVLLDQDGRALLEYFVENPKNGVRTKHVHAFMRHEATSIEIHITKTAYVASNQKQIDRLLDSMRVVPKSSKG